MTNAGSVVIETSVEDIHALAVQWSIRKAGGVCELIYGDDFPSREQITMEQAPCGKIAVTFRNPTRTFRVRQGDPLTYWVRRTSGPLIDDGIHPSDQRVALREAEAALGGARQILGMPTETFCVNNLKSRAWANSKPVQLSIAASVGFRVPRTLISNARAEVLQFLASVEGRAVYKPFCPAYWMAETTRFAGLAAIVSGEDIPEGNAVQYSPGIYQEYIEKQHEVRLVAMGATMFATKLHSQASPKAAIDWRGLVSGVEQTVLPVPDEIHAMCRAFMARSGIVFGCFDFIVTPENQWVFLECNEQGQWLWQESVCPELPLLDAFVAFLRGRSADFVYARPANPIGFSEYTSSREYAERTATWARHVKPTIPFRSEEPVAS